MQTYFLVLILFAPDGSRITMQAIDSFATVDKCVAALRIAEQASPKSILACVHPIYGVPA